MLTYPNLNDKFDIFMIVSLGATLPMYLFADYLNIPLVNRRGILLSYSKFANGIDFGIIVSSRLGMTLFYLPAAFVAIYSLLSAKEGTRGFLVAIMMLVHFTKRSLECLFLHKYSGTMPLSTSFNVAVFYIVIVLSTCMYASQRNTFQSNEMVFRDTGLFLFALGIAGNFYHHFLLAKLRKRGEKNYKVPSGCLFEYVAAPHYFFELIGWFGVAITVQHLIVVWIAVNMTVYLTGRAIAQSEWNKKNLKGKYPSKRKHIFPFVF